MSIARTTKTYSKLIFFIVLILTVVFPCLVSHPQTRGIDISGIVSEANSGEVLIGANLMLYKDSLKVSDPVRGTATNKYGFYSIPGLPLGVYYLFVSSMGYETSMKRIVVRDTSRAMRVNFALEKKAIKLEEVVVEDRRKTDFTNTTSTIQIEVDLVKQLPSIGGETDIFRALQLLPGVTAATEISTGIYVRGGSPDQNLTLVDGVVVYNPAHLGGFASTFNSDALQNIKLLKGAFPAEFGTRLSSVLDVTMRGGWEEKFTGTAGLNLISSRITLEGPLDHNSTFILSGRKMFLDKILPLIPQANTIPRYSFHDINGKINYRINENDKIFISGFYSDDILKEPPSNKDVGFDINWSNATVNLTWTRISSSTMFTNTSLMYTNYNFSTLIKDKAEVKNPLDFFTSSVINDFMLKREVQIFFSDDHNFKTGAELTYHDFNTTTSDYFIKELQYKPQYGKTLNALEGSIYAQDEWQISEDFKTNIGGRFYYFQNAKFFAFEPRASITYFLLDRFIIRGGFSVANQTLHLLSRNDVYLPTDVWYPSTSLIRPSRAIQGSIGFEATSFERTFLFSLEAYYKDMKNLYEYKENADFSFESNFEEQLTVGRGEAYGVELFLNKRLGNITGWVGYTLAWTKKYFDDLNRGLVFYPRYDRRHDVSIALTYEPYEELSFGATWTYGTGQAYSLPVGQYAFQGISRPGTQSSAIFYEYSKRDAYRLPPFHKLDLSVIYNFNWGMTPIELSLNIYNAYNRYNVFSKYIGYKKDEVTGEETPVLKQFTLFPFLPTIGVKFNF